MHSDKNSHISILAIITALCLLGDSMLYIVLPVYYQQVGLSSLWEVGIVLSVNRLVRLPLNPLIGWFYNHISERTGILIAVALAVLTTIAYGWLPGLVWWIVARCLWGVAWTLLRLGALFSILRVSTTENRGQLTGKYNGLYRLGSLGGMLLGGLLADQIGFQNTVLIFGAVTACAGFLAFSRLPKSMATSETTVTKQRSVIRAFAELVGQPHVLWIMASGAAVAFVTQGVIASTLSRLIDTHTNGDITIWGMMLGAATLAGFFQALRWSWEPWLAPFVGQLSDQRFTRTGMMYAAFGVGAAGMLLLALSLPLFLWFLCLLIVQLIATILNTVTEALASDTASKNGGRALLMSFALMVDVGAAIGPLVAYFMNAYWGINSVYLLCALLFLVLCLKWYFYQRKTKPVSN